jgi:hypothetical protein
LTARVRGVFDDLLGQALALGQPLRPAPRPPQGAIRCQLHRPGRAARRRNPDPVRVTTPADPAGTPDFREPAARFDRHAQGPVPPLSSLDHGAHGTSAVTRGPDRRLHGQGNHRRRHASFARASRGTWSSAIPSWSTASPRTGAHGRVSCGSRRRFSPARAASCGADSSGCPPRPSP